MVAAGGDGIEVVALDVHDRHIEGAAAEVIDQHAAVRALIQTEGNGGGRGLVDHREHIQPRNGAGLLGGGAACIVKVRRYGDDHIFDCPLADELLGVLRDLAQNEGGEHFGSIFLAARADVVELRPALSHAALDELHHIVRIGGCGVFGVFAHQHIVIPGGSNAGEENDGRRDIKALHVFQDRDLVILIERNGAVGGAEVNAEGFSFHKRSLLYFSVCRM